MQCHQCRVMQGAHVYRQVRGIPSEYKPAIEMGFTTCWIDRRGNKGGGITPKLESPIKPHFKFGSMAELVKAVKMELV